MQDPKNPYVVTLEDAIRSVKQFDPNTSLNTDQKRFLDTRFMAAMITVLGEEKKFLVDMTNDWDTTRERFRGLLKGLTFISILACFGSVPGIIIGLTGLIIIIVIRIKLHNSHDNSLSTKPPKFKTYAASPNIKQSMFDQDIEVIKWLKNQIELAQKDAWRRFEDRGLLDEIYHHSRLAVDYFKERTSKIRNNLWQLIWPTGDFLPHSQTPELDKQTLYLNQLESYLEEYRSIRFPHITPHTPVYDEI